MLILLAQFCVALVLKSRGQFIVFVLTVSLVTTVCEREMYPHIDPYLGAFVYLLSWQILLCVLALLVMDSEMTKDFESFFLGVVLLIVNIIMIGVVFLDTRGDIVRERIENNMAYLNRLNSVRVSLSPFKRKSKMGSQPTQQQLRLTLICLRTRS